MIAESLILIAGKFDLSLESTVGLRADARRLADRQRDDLGGSGFGLNVWLAILVLFATGALVGVINGFLVVRLRLNAFIVTLAMLILLRGVTLGITNGKTLFDLPRAFLYLGSGKWLGVPVSIWLAGVLYLSGRPVPALPPHGPRDLRDRRQSGGGARGRHPGRARSRSALYVAGGLLAALAGLMLTGRIASVVASQGQNMIFYVFAAAVIGGISLNGGRGRWSARSPACCCSVSSRTS